MATFFPEPSFLLTQQPTLATLPVLDVRSQPGLANALLLSGHPFVSRLPDEVMSTCWTLAKLETELVHGGSLRSRAQRTGSTARGHHRPTPRARINGAMPGVDASPPAPPAPASAAPSTYLCGTQVHPVAESGVVAYNHSDQRLPCKALLRALRSRRTHAYGVVSVEEARGERQCLAGMRRLGGALGALHDLTRLATADQHAPSLGNLRLGTSTPNASAYPLHYDRVENVCAQRARTHAVLSSALTRTAASVICLAGPAHRQSLVLPRCMRAPSASTRAPCGL